MAAELSIVIKHWEPVPVSAVLNERIAAIQPMIVDVDDYKEQALHLLVHLFCLNLKLLKMERYLIRLSNEISRKKKEL